MEKQKKIKKSKPPTRPIKSVDESQEWRDKWNRTKTERAGGW